MLEVRLARGLFLPGLDLWMDPRFPAPRAFVSHAHSDHTGRHALTLATPETLDLMRLRMGPGKRTQEAIAFGETREFEGFRLRLLPAGHILGSAQCFVESGSGSLLYTGDFKLRAGLTSGAAGSCRAETLVMETTFGRPGYVFPPFESVRADIAAFCRETLGAGEVPVLLAYSLGKAQEVLALLANAGLPAMPHPSITKLLPVYESAGHQFPAYAEWEPSLSSGCVLVCPPSARGALAGVCRARTALISGWALDPSAIHRSRCDAAFPLSDHAGYDELLRHVEAVAPRRVLTLHGFAQEFARDLRARGIEAWALTGPNQLDLPL